HPSIILWILFNEGWGQYDTARLTQWVKSIDPSRLVNNASGWTDARVGDIVDMHSYPGPDSPEPESRRAAVLGEFGGFGLPIDHHSWSSNRWGYQTVLDSESLASAYSQLLERAWTLHDQRGLSAMVYTQIADVETECNGLLTYDRAIAKLDPSVLAKANRTTRRGPIWRTIVPVARQGLVPWKYTFQAPEADWFKLGFNAAHWRDGVAGFGVPNTPGARIGTLWNTSDIWLRREFVLGREDTKDLKLTVHHDEDTEIYLNGVLAARLSGFITSYKEFDILPEAVATLKQGTNSLAVHCRQKGGGQYIDVGLVAP
ncbi:MAG TPA: glycoside hydrolase family 2 TIM barrel-domain containing protein, partial [Bacillota bacterium]|nr:glycoside hydrolase family 2 TIM barrel-domain containing protein [Bacillota bacterium]